MESKHTGHLRGDCYSDRRAVGAVGGNRAEVDVVGGERRQLIDCVCARGSVEHDAPPGHELHLSDSLRVHKLLGRVVRNLPSTRDKLSLLARGCHEIQ
jgi:hypothetical protein